MMEIPDVASGLAPDVRRPKRLAPRLDPGFLSFPKSRIIASKSIGTTILNRNSEP